jgi:shikimate dehydrogenase
MINANTQIYGLIGNPVSGSKSPWIHNTVFETLDIPAAYLAFNVQEGHVKSAYDGLRALGAGGFNITIPYKTEIMGYLDAIDPVAQKLGAVNTVHFQAGRATGYNTDGMGLISVLQRHDSKFRMRRVLVIGAGGAARGICGMLLESGIPALGVWNRTSSKAEALIGSLEAFGGDHQQRILCRLEDFRRFDLVINTTSVGTEPDLLATPIDIKLLKPGAIVCDIVYKPHQTQLLKDAQHHGHPTIYGIEMLIEQALLAQKIWSDLDDDNINDLRQLMMSQLEQSVSELPASIAK